MGFPHTSPVARTPDGTHGRIRSQWLFRGRVTHHGGLRGVNLRRADLRFADLRGAILLNTNLTGANLSKAMGMNLAVRGNATCPDGVVSASSPCSP